MADAKKSNDLRQPGRLWRTPIYLLAAVAAAILVFVLALWLMHLLLEIQTPAETQPPIPTRTPGTTTGPAASPAPSAMVTKQLHLDTVKVALTVVAGVGGLVALVVAYSRNRRHEYENYRAELEHRRAEAARIGRTPNSSTNGSAPPAPSSGTRRLRSAWPASTHSRASPTTGSGNGKPTSTYCAPTSECPTPRPMKVAQSMRQPTPLTWKYYRAATDTDHSDPRAEREVRATVVRVLTAHLRSDAVRLGRATT